MKLLTLSFLFFTLPALALPSFSADEIQKHQQNIRTLAEVSGACLDEYYADHEAFFKKYGVSKYFGDRRTDYATEKQRRAVLKSYGFSQSKIDEIAPQQVGTSCIGLTRACLKRGFAAIGQSDVWLRIDQFLRANGVKGNDLQLMLIALGWKSYYWNPDPSKNADWDYEEQVEITPLSKQEKADGKKWKPVWGGHVLNYANAVNKGIYYNIPVHDVNELVGFGDVAPKPFQNVKFFVGIAHVGYHVFPGRFGDVIEAHSKRDMSARDNLEFSKFNPLGSGGGPRWTPTERYRSGVIVVPEAF